MKRSIPQPNAKQDPWSIPWQNIHIVNITVSTGYLLSATPAWTQTSAHSLASHLGHLAKLAPTKTISIVLGLVFTQNYFVMVRLIVHQGKMRITQLVRSFTKQGALTG